MSLSPAFYFLREIEGAQHLNRHVDGFDKHPVGKLTTIGAQRDIPGIGRR
jgi:hypothetical protein